MTIIDKLASMEKHPIYGKLFDKLTADELSETINFIHNNQSLNDNQYMHKANRWYLDITAKPRHLVDMWSIVTQVRGYEP